MADQVSVATPGRIDIPRGRYPGRLDSAGRLKLPAAFWEYFKGLEDKRLFITSLDLKVAQVYPIASWWENEKTLEELESDRTAADDMLFNATDLGAQVEADSQGRVTFNSDLRRELGFEGQELQLFGYRNRIEVMTDAMYQEQKKERTQRAGESAETVRKAGVR